MPRIVRLVVLTALFGRTVFVTTTDGPYEVNYTE